MNTEKIKELAKILNREKLTHVEYSMGDERIILKKEPPKQTPQLTGLNPFAPAAPAASTQVNISETNLNENIVLAKDAETVNSPMVGVFYRSPAPDTEPFIREGSKVKKGDVICIIEAMKLMNEILADKDMEIVKILVENGQVVEFSQPLLVVK